ncbi:phospholipase D-like domain-containing protein [Janthinobacterium agaricidamnosum]|uniref:Cardiolipin synthase B n=1 Tax=Janthinobacterium agaricidamnosum NBRC 102515 = DSM 9628 TaxID=1349767 RepID=W0VDK0_9BURK|nr:phospholipase D-like domain-containing protein [Janthinobacterium agaricidamnosum]CDG85443.1 phospholipase D Active site motif family protein [Janthinobacterium agaricidamnosum NBRC 102515 = DSM 9628]
MRSVNFIAHNDIKLLRSGTDYFPALIAAIDGARSEIYFETYIFAADATGASVLDALIRAAGRGLLVCMITDWYGTGNRRVNAMHAQLEAAQVHHRIFNAWFRRGITRTHRKICVVDRELAFVGGININDDMFCDYDHRISLSAPRWDFAVQVRGPLVDVIHKEAQVQWARLGKMNLIKRINLYREMRAVNKALAHNPVMAGFVVRDNLRNRRTIQRAYLQALGRARKSVLLANPYFAPGRKFREALASAARRGVDVVLLIGVGEIWLQDAVAHSFYPKLLEAGVKVVEYHKTQLHAKVAVIDDDWATVGSSNVDGLSLFLNQEANVVIKDAGFACTLRQQIEQAIADGVVVHQDDFAHVGRWRRLGYEAAFLGYKIIMRIFAVGKYA